MSEFWYNGKSSAEFGMLIESRPTRTIPKRKRTQVPVAGRNGALHIDEGAFENITKGYSCGFQNRYGMEQKEQGIAKWLMSGDGYCRLEDSYEQDIFRLATFSGPADIESLLGKLGKCKIKFDCDPRSFLKSGEIPIDFESAGTLLNPTAFTALPLIRVYGSGAGVVTVGDRSVEIKVIEDYMYLDCEMENAYTISEVTGLEVNQNTHVYAPRFPVLTAGSNAISFSGGIERVQITPRWWTI